MIKLEYVVFFLLFVGSGAYVWHFFRRLRRDHFSKLVERAFLRRQASGGENAFFCEPLLRRIVVLLLRDGKKALRPLLALTLGRHTPAEKYLRSRGRELEALLLRAHVSPQRALPGVKKYVRKIRKTGLPWPHWLNYALLPVMPDMARPLWIISV